MFLDLLAHVSAYGHVTLLVLSLTVVTFTWLGRGWGILMGQLYLGLSVLHLDLNIFPGPLDQVFYMLAALHLLLVNLLLTPAWVLGLLLAKMQKQHRAAK